MEPSGSEDVQVAESLLVLLAGNTNTSSSPEKPAPAAPVVAAASAIDACQEIPDETIPADDVFYIQCDACQEWHDAGELDLTPSEANQYDLWHCVTCAPFAGPSRRKSHRKGLRPRARVEYRKLNDPTSVLQEETGGGSRSSSKIGLAANDVQPVDYPGLLRQRQKKGLFAPAASGCLLSPSQLRPFHNDLTAYAQQFGFEQPILVDDPPAAIGLKVPPRFSNTDDGTLFSYATVAQLVGPYRSVPVLDTATQLTHRTLTLQEWVDYMELSPQERSSTLNVITLEFSSTPLSEWVTEPEFARAVDLARQHWPSQQDEERPRVSKYCLMSAAGSYTDFHVDFGGTSVWYHLYKGQKVFYLVPPTPENLKIYQKWATNDGTSRAAKKQETFLPDLFFKAAGSQVYELVLEEGQTLFIPSGWIHAVHTPVDSLVFGGNFVHCHALEMQLTIYRLERLMKVQREYQFPNYQKLLWYTARDFLRQCVEDIPNNNNNNKLTTTTTAKQSKKQKGGALGKQILEKLCAKNPPHILRGYRALARELERWSTSKTKHVTEQHPEGMNVGQISSQLSRITNLCVAYLDQKERDRSKRRREREILQRKKRERAEAVALAERKKLKREKERVNKVRERRKALESHYEEVTWAQCDRCDEWHEASLESLADSSDDKPFFCSHVHKTCKETAATEWMQCTLCKAWHTTPKANDSCREAAGGTDEGKTSNSSVGFTCEHFGKKCSAKKYQRAELALCS